MVEIITTAPTIHCKIRCCWGAGVSQDLHCIADNLAATQASQASNVDWVSTDSTSYVLMPDMTITLTTGNNPVLIIFSCQCFVNFAGYAGYLALHIDGELKPFAERYVDVFGNMENVAMSIQTLESLTAGEHTFELKWHAAVGSTLYAAGKALTVIELKI